MHNPTTHRVTPSVADAWFVGDAHPPGPGFEEIAPPRIPLLLRVVAWLLLLGAAFAVGYWL